MAIYGGNKSMTKTISMLCILFGTAVLFWTYLQAGYWLAASGLTIVGLTWLAAQRRNIAWFSTWGLFIFSIAAAVGILLDLPAFLMILGALSGLMAWDLVAFHQRLSFAAPTDNTMTLERRHLYWLSLAALSGLILSTIAGMIDLQLSFFLTVLLVLIAVMGVVQLFSWLRQ